MKALVNAKGFLTLSLLLIVFLVIPETASAASSTGMMDDVLTKYKTATAAWGNKMVAYGSWLFWGLAIISMVWTYGMMLLRKADIGEFFAETIRFFGTLGFFWWILLNGPAIAGSIITSMFDIAVAVSGTGADNYTPSGIVDIGFDIFFKSIDDSSITSPVKSGLAILIAVCVMVVLALIAVNMLLLFVSGWILMYGGVLFLGFGGSRWTSDIAITYYKTVMGVGAQLLSMVLIVGIGKTFVDEAYAGMSAGINIKELGVLLITAVVLLYLTDKLPPMIAGIVGGGSTGSIGSFGAGAALGAAMGAAGMAAAAATAGGAMALAGAANMAGAGSALKAAFQSAQENMGSSGGGGGGGSDVGGGGGSGDTGSIGGSEGGGGSGGGSGGGGSNSGGGSSFGQAMGTAGRFAADMGSALASGAKSGLSAKANSVVASVNERVANTMGGKLASEINGSAGQARADQQTLAQAAAIDQGQQLQDARDTVAEHNNTDTSSQPDSGSGSVSSGNDEVNEFVNGKA